MPPEEVKSEKWSLNAQDRRKWLQNSLLFLSPLATIYLGFIAANIELDGFAWSDFQPSNMVIGSMMLYVVNTLLDLLRKFAAGSEG